MQKQIAALYVRLSQEDRNKLSREDESESIINQQNILTDYCKRNSFEIYDIYKDEDFSGSDRERPEFNRMISDAREKRFNTIICKTQSRFARDMELIEKYVNGLFPIWGIRFVGVVDNADSTNKFNRKQRQITSLVDQWYLEDLSENVKATLASKRKQGLWVGAFAPYGYIKDPDNKNHLIVDEEAAEVVRYIFDLYLQGYGITPIARKLNEQGIPNPATYKQKHGQPFQNAHKECSDIWHTYSIGRMLSNLVYRGCVVQGMSENISYKSTKKRQKPKDEWDIVEGTHEPIIDQCTWDKVQRLRASKPKACNMGEPNIFAGKVKCLNCGNSMRIYYTHHERYYRCSTHYFASDRCSGTFVSEKVLQREVLKQIRLLYQQYVDEAYISDNLNIENGARERDNSDLGIDSQGAEARYALTQSNFRPGDVLFLSSVSGRTKKVVDLAYEAVKLGIKVIAFTSMEYAVKVDPVHPSGKKLYEIATITIDNCAPAAEAMLDVDGIEAKFGAASGIASDYIMWSITSVAVEKLLEKGITPGILKSANYPGGMEYNKTVVEPNYDKYGW